MQWLKWVKRQHVRFLALLCLSLGLVTCSASTSLEPIAYSVNADKAAVEDTATDIRIVWTQGFLPEENAAVVSLVADWEKESGLKADLTLFSQRDIIQETNKAVDAGNPPDVLFIVAGDTDLIPLQAWEDQLADVSKIIEPIKANYTEAALEASFYPNHVTNEPHYYAIPLAQQATNIHYWKSLLESVNLREENIPSDWNGFWNFWKEAQDRMRKQGKQDIFALALCMSDKGQDTNQIFLEFLNAYGVEMVDKTGKLRLGEPEQRGRAVQALTQFVDLYRDKYVPSDANTWTDAGNNINFLEGRSVLTANGTLSVPLTQKQSVNQYNKVSNDRYLNEVRTLAKWPRNPDGSPHRSTVGIKQVVAFKEAAHPEAAAKFLEYLTRPEVVNSWLSNQKGRFFPVMPQLLQDPFWAQNDPHLAAGLALLKQGVEPGYQVYTPAFSQMLSQKVLASAVLKVINGMSAEQAIDDVIEQAKQIFAEFR
ncbi:MULTISPECIES: ABC transporter substrate-binding protein [unclassified Leptolyngbya]|uniref:ABC transporter substrate-binding protein n=1 Tax=unclassified Leptolyngbya TaxID=2650499 RepID=UPI0016875E06|nr:MULTISPECIES: ABC transporter substrate-binding protein [unclassified Leptolyngbya]MBD1911024.1 carbohydrate ABC transporter substrate-binding protein [Leptolyngbya sp. FACHB-8]MBD2158310.1 carbohydrate ABC transporter substrate-binding protein [Leptolyngbya sp. FACHB-16]